MNPRIIDCMNDRRNSLEDLNELSRDLNGLGKAADRMGLETLATELACAAKSIKDNVKVIIETTAELQNIRMSEATKQTAGILGQLVGELPDEPH